MTLDEAEKIGRIIGTADGGCDTCISLLADQMNEAFPEFWWEVTDEEIRVQSQISDDPEDTEFIGWLVRPTPKDPTP